MSHIGNLCHLHFSLADKNMMNLLLVFTNNKHATLVETTNISKECSLIFMQDIFPGSSILQYFHFNNVQVTGSQAVGNFSLGGHSFQEETGMKYWQTRLLDYYMNKIWTALFEFGRGKVILKVWWKECLGQNKLRTFGFRDITYQ